MVKLKGFTTVEAIISSVLILLSISGAGVIFMNVISSGTSIEFEARTKLFELSQEERIAQRKAEIWFEHYSVEVSVEEYLGYDDLQLIRLIAYDMSRNELGSLNLLRRTQE